MSLSGGALPLAGRSQVLLVYDNRLVGRKGTNVSADSVATEGNMATSNLLNEFRVFWKSGSVAARSVEPVPEISVTYSLSSARDIDWLSGHWWNVCVPWRADCYRGNPLAGGLLLGSTGWMNPIVKSTTADFDHGNFPWIMGPSRERIMEMFFSMRLQSFANLSEVIYGVDTVVWRFDVSEGTNGGADFIQAGLLFAGRAFQPTINMSLGANIVPIDRSLLRRSAGGELDGIGRRVASELTFVLDHLSDQEGMTRLFADFVKREGYLARVFVYKEPQPEKRVLFYDGGAFVGTLESFDAIAIDQHEGEIGGIEAAKNVKGIKIQEI